MKYQASITKDVNADDEKHAALEGYKQIMLAGTDVKTVTVTVRDAAGVVNDIELDVEEADDYAGFNPPIGFRG